MSDEAPVEEPYVLAMTAREWADYADSFNVSPQMVMGALREERTYTRDEADARITAFLDSPADKE